MQVTMFNNFMTKLQNAWIHMTYTVVDCTRI